MTMTVGEYTASGWSVDTRTLNAGDFFFALRGPSHDGHAYVAAAFEKGALAAMVDHAMPGPVVVVPDTQRGLEDSARAARRQWGGKVIGVTGSSGKTGTKDIIAACLAAAVSVAKNEGNLNNHVGLPLSILRLPETATAAVLEMGMNHAGEIRHLAGIAVPDIGVVTNAGYAHIENFESAEGIALAKRELIESLSPNGTAVLNADDARVARFGQETGVRSISYGLSSHANIRAENVEYAEDRTTFTVFGEALTIFLPGRHALSNVLAGIAVATIFDIPVRSLAPVLARLKAGTMRGERFSHNGVLILNDSYNSNPEAARAMLDVLGNMPAGRRIAVLGEMLELGHWTEPLHRDIGRYAVAQGISVLVGIRGAARHTVYAAREAGLPESAAIFCEDPVEAGQILRELSGPGDAILFKGSRGTRVELALETFLAENPGAAG